MKIFYHPQFNIDFGIFNRIHPFDGVKFRRVYEKIKSLPNIDIVQPTQAIHLDIVKKHLNELMRLRIDRKSFVLRALELPDIPLIPFSLIERKILTPMRLGVAATLEASKLALQGHHCWNMSGGYHHASPASAEGFCVYNDIHISIQELRAAGLLQAEDGIIIIDVDAHHGNGNGHAFYEDKQVLILDQYNRDIYPHNKFYTSRVNIDLPLANGTMGPLYLQTLERGLQNLGEMVKGKQYKLAYIVAGTDVLAEDDLGNLGLTIAECQQRDTLILQTLQQLEIPAVFLGGGGYSKQSAEAIAASISHLHTW